MKFYINLLLIISMLAFVVACGGKEETKPEETQDDTDQIEEMLPDTDEMMDNAEEAADSIGSAMEEGAEEVKDAVEEVKEAVSKTDYTDSPLQGYVVSLDHLVKGGDGRVSKAEAEDLVANGKTLLFKSGDEVYLVLNEGGNYAGKKLASYAAANKVGLKGKVTKSHGINMFMMTFINAM